MAKAKLNEVEAQQEREAYVMETMAKCQVIAKEIFGDATAYAVEELFDYLDNGADEQEFAKDLKRIHELAKTIYVTQTPTPEQTFGIFTRVFEAEE